MNANLAAVNAMRARYILHCTDCGAKVKRADADGNQIKWFEAWEKENSLTISDLPPYPFLCTKCFSEMYAI